MIENLLKLDRRFHIPALEFSGSAETVLEDLRPR
jgi:hypothetical protein